MSNKKPDKLIEEINYTPPSLNWMDTKPAFIKGNYNYAANPESIKYIEQPNPRKWQPYDDDWKLPDNWKEIIINGLKQRIKSYRSLQIFMDSCVRCGACADKCHFFIGSGDPKNMPVLRAELLRSIYKNEFSRAGKILGRFVGSRKLNIDVIKEWFYYYYQCTQCRRCSIFCPFGIDTAEITLLARELLNLIGINIDWIMTPIKNSHRTGNHLGIQPHGMLDSIEFAIDDIEEKTGVRVQVPLNKKGAEVLFITPSADYFAEPHYFTLLGYFTLFHEIGLDYTMSTYCSEGGNFGSFVSHNLMKALNEKIYAEAKRLKVKWILGGECGHMWRVINQYMDTMNGPADFLEIPKSPITNTIFNNASSTKMVHIAEFTADLIKNNKLKLDKSRNDHWHTTFHDSCNLVRGMGLIEEPRYILNNVMNKFTEMPYNTIREQSFCCGSGAGLGTEENFEMRMRGGFPRANAVDYVKNKFGVNLVSCMCAIDKATLPTLFEYWVPGIEVAGVHELLANALVMKNEKNRTTDFRAIPFINNNGKS